MAIAKNNTDYVSTGKGVAGGYFFSAAKPATDEAFQTLIAKLLSLSNELSEDDGFANLGYISSDGMTVSESVSTTNETDMNGDTVYTTSSDRTETLACNLLEQNVAAFKEVYGTSNVTVDKSGVVTIHHTNAEHENRIYVAELVLKDGRRKRMIIGAGQVTEHGDQTINSSTLLGNDITITCNSFSYKIGDDDFSDTIVEVIGEVA